MRITSISVTGEKKGICTKCGKSFKERKTFSKIPEPLLAVQVYDYLNKQTEIWQKMNICKHCLNTEVKA